jgi:hypothetical protein
MNYSICTDFEQHIYPAHALRRANVSHQYLTQKRLAGHGSIYWNSSYTQEILVNELSTISIFFSGVRFPYLFPLGVAVLRIKSTWLYNPFW